MNVHIRAQLVARIFDILAWAILVIGGIATLFGLVATFAAPREGLVILVIVVVQTALAWAAVTLGAVIAGYIAQRTADATT